MRHGDVEVRPRWAEPSRPHVSRSCRHCCLITQLRTAHIELNKCLSRIRAVDFPPLHSLLCPGNGGPLRPLLQVLPPRLLLLPPRAQEAPLPYNPPRRPGRHHSSPQLRYSCRPVPNLQCRHTSAILSLPLLPLVISHVLGFLICMVFLMDI